MKNQIIKILKKILLKYSINTRYRIRYFLFWFLEKKYYQHDFPLNVRKNLYKIFSFEKKKFIMLPYQAPEHVGYLSPSDLNNYTFEIIPYHKVNDYRHFNKNKDFILPLSLNSERKKLNLKHGKKLIILKNIPANKFQHFFLRKNTHYHFSSSNLIIGKPSIIHGIKKPKINVLIFVDGLAHFSNFLNNGATLNDVMPNTNIFFQNGIHFESNYADSEWTLPSTASLFTGTFQQNHRFFHPRSHQVLKNKSTIGASFQKAGFTSFNIGGGWRNSPAYGHATGADRALFQKYMPGEKVVHHTMDHLSGLKRNNHFIQMTFLETHHLLGTIPEFSSQLNLSPEGHKVTPFFDPVNKKKSISSLKDIDLIEIYKEQVFSLDKKLGVFFNFLYSNYNEEQLYVTLVSDHGHAFLSSEINPLCKARTHVPWLLKYPGSQKKIITELTQNVDLFSTMHFINNIKLNKEKNDGVVPEYLSREKGREYSFSQSIYPEKKYQLIIRSKDFEHFFETYTKISKTGFIDLSAGYSKSIKSKVGKVTKQTNEDNIIQDLFLSFVTNWNKKIT